VARAAGITLQVQKQFLVASWKCEKLTNTGPCANVVGNYFYLKAVNKAILRIRAGF
jgi:hypothetical protein